MLGTVGNCISLNIFYETKESTESLIAVRTSDIHHRVDYPSPPPHTHSTGVSCFKEVVKCAFWSFLVWLGASCRLEDTGFFFSSFEATPVGAVNENSRPGWHTRNRRRFLVFVKAGPVASTRSEFATATGRQPSGTGGGPPKGSTRPSPGGPRARLGSGLSKKTRGHLPLGFAVPLHSLWFPPEHLSRIAGHFCWGHWFRGRKPSLQRPPADNRRESLGIVDDGRTNTDLMTCGCVLWKVAD